MSTESTKGKFFSVDQNRILSLLSSYAAAIVKAGVLHQADVDELRIHLREWHANSRHQNSPIQYLSSIQSNALDVFLHHSGPISFSKNALRSSYVAFVDEMIRAYKSTASLFLDRATILFNRSFAITVDRSNESVGLLSTPILSTTEQILFSAQLLTQARAGLATLLTGDSVPQKHSDQAVDQEISAALGFTKCGVANFTLNEEQTCLDLTVVAIKSFARSLAQLTDLFGPSIADRRFSERMKIVTDAIFSTSASLTLDGFTVTNAHLGWELKRNQLVASFDQLISLTEQCSAAVVDILAGINAQPQQGFVVARNVGRRVMVDLVQKGTSVPVARTAVKELMDHLSTSKLQPSRILPGELARINRSITDDTLTTLQETERGASLGMVNFAEKERNAKLLTTLKSAVTSLAVFLIASSICIGCGLKGDPRSKLKEPRPDVPVHAATKNVNK
jgi:hypothetical protein